MQILCGQCGTQLQAEPHPDARSIQCPNCGHEIPLLAAADIAPTPTGGGDEGFADYARRALNARALITCGHCGVRMKVGRRLAGKEVRCPSCSGQIQIPMIDDSALMDFAGPEAFDDDAIELQEMAAAVPKSRVSRRQSKQGGGNRKVVWIVTVAVAIGLVAILGYLASSAFAPDDSMPDDIPLDEPAVKAQPSTPKQAPAEKVAGSKLLSTKWDWFAAAGYFPTSPDKRYCKIAVELQAGSEAVEFSDFGQAVEVVLEDQVYRSLGRAIDYGQAVGPVFARRGVVKLEAGESGRFTFLFELPAQAGSGSMSVGPLPKVDFFLASPGESPMDIAGQYVEQAPRNLKPMLKNSVMRAIQNAPNQGLSIRRSGGGFLVSIPQANVHGAAMPRGQGVYTVVLQFAGEALTCKLALLPDGRQLVLYLSDKPMHQMTYRRRPGPDKPQSPEATKAPKHQTNEIQGDKARPNFFGI